MKNLIKGSPILLLLTIGACTTPESDFHYVPGSASIVAKVEMPSLVDKSNINHVRDSVGFGLMETALGFFNVPDFLTDRSITGIDYSQNIYAFKADSTKSSPLVTMFWIANEDSLQQFIKRLDKSMLPEEANGITNIHSELGTVVYKQDRAYFSRNRDSATVDLLNSYLDLGRENSLAATHPDVVEKLEADDDIGMWTSQRKLMEFESPLAFTNQRDAVVRKTMAALNFGQGQMEMNYGEFGNDKLTSLYQQALEGEYNEALLRGMPENMLPGIVSIHVKPATHRHLMTQIGWYDQLAGSNGYSTYAATQFGSLLSRLDENFSGASVWGITGFKAVKEKGGGGLFKQNVNKAFFNWHIAIGLDNAAATDSLLQNMANAGDNRLQDGKSYYTFPGAPFPYRLAVHNGVLLIANDEPHMHEMLTGDQPVPSWKENIKQQMQQYPVYATLSPEIWSMMQGKPQGLSPKAIVSSLMGNALLAVDRINVKGYSGDETALRIDMEMTFSDSSQNSLELLISSMFEKLTMESLQGGF